MNEAAHLEILVKVTLNLAQQRHIYPQGLLKRLTEAQAAIVRELVCYHTPRPEWLADWEKREDAIQAAAKDPAERVRIAKLAAEARWRGHIAKRKNDKKSQQVNPKNKFPESPEEKIKQAIAAPSNKTTSLFGVKDISPSGLKKYGLTNNEGKPYKVLFNTSVYGHLMAEHGDEATEIARGQIALNADDMLLLPEIFGAPDTVAPVQPHGKVRRTGINGEPRFDISKRIGETDYFGVAEIKQGKRGVAPVSLWKRRAK